MCDFWNCGVPFLSRLEIINNSGIESNRWSIRMVCYGMLADFLYGPTDHSRRTQWQIKGVVEVQAVRLRTNMVKVSLNTSFLTFTYTCHYPNYNTTCYTNRSTSIW